MTKIKIILGDITKQEVEVIVNAVNRSLLRGGGVDGAIHKAAGPKLLEECRKLGGCETGKAKITKGYNLSAKFIIHTVGPVYGEENGKVEELLRNCYVNSLNLAKNFGLKTIAMPAISTGAYGFPKEKAAKIVFETLREYVKKEDFLDEIRLVLHKEEGYKMYEKLFKSFKND